jgi:hypothetical protein
MSFQNVSSGAWSFENHVILLERSKKDKKKGLKTNLNQKLL